MKRVPVLPTLVVAIAVAIMIGLGWWQIFDRLPRKEAYLAQLAANPAKPPIAFPATPDDRLLFRRATGECRPPVTTRRAGAGSAGYRIIADCSGSDMTVQLGTTRDPTAQIAWAGGLVTGYLSHAPTGQSVIGAAFAASGAAPMILVADTPPAGLSANARPDLSAVPNNHLAYGVQWFAFAAIATVIYALAVLWRRPVRPQA